MAHKQTEETRLKISNALKGKRPSRETREKQSETRKQLFSEGKLVSWNKGKKGLQKGLKGEANPNWQGGRYRDKKGYIWVRSADHPNANSSNVIAEHRLVMSEHLGRPLCPWENVHHKNGVRYDNRVENLQLVLKGVHKGDVKCPFCNKHFAIR